MEKIFFLNAVLCFSDQRDAVHFLRIITVVDIYGIAQGFQSQDF